MTPRGIVREALAKNISIIGITDHNSAQNTAAVVAAARGTDLCVIPGMEVTTAEEVHLLALFETVAGAQKLQETVFQRLQPGENDEELFGMQVVANEFDEVEGFNPRLLIGTTSLTIDELVELVHRLDGLAIPAHIDRSSYSILTQLGFIPDYLEIDAVEISKNLDPAQARAGFGLRTGLALITSSDSHRLEDIGAATTRLRLCQPSFAELTRALQGVGGRRIME